MEGSGTEKAREKGPAGSLRASEQHLLPAFVEGLVVVCGFCFFCNVLWQRLLPGLTSGDKFSRTSHSAPESFGIFFSSIIW